MDEPLISILRPRAQLIASDDANLTLLRQLDRKLLLRLSSGQLDRPAFKAALEQQLVTDLAGVLPVLEALEQLHPGQLAKAQLMLLGTGSGGSAWWLAAHYPQLETPDQFPEGWPDQVWAALALKRRGLWDLLPGAWRFWAQPLESRDRALQAAETLWQESAGEDWENWLGPLLVGLDEDRHRRLINWLAPRLPAPQLVRALGLSCRSRFIPWLESMGQQQQLAAAAARELRWLQGGEPEPAAPSQCWGQKLEKSNSVKLFRSLPLGLRPRLWHWCREAIVGSPRSLMGGRWCPGN